MLKLALLLGSVAVPAGMLSAQAVMGGVEAGQVEGRGFAGAPIAGYVIGPGAVELHAVLLVSHTLKMGGPVSVPVASRRIYLPPRQQSALVDQGGNEATAVWAVHQSATTGVTQGLVAIPGAMAHPDAVTFSPRGESVLLYSQATSRLQVIRHLPAEPVVERSLNLPGSVTPRLALSDDGEVVVAASADGSVVRSTSVQPSWQPLALNVVARAVSFLPRTHELVVSDITAGELTLVSHLDGDQQSTRVIAQNVNADRLVTTRGGERLMAANMRSGEIWTIDMTSSSPLQKEQAEPANEFYSLRDGYTFLLSTKVSTSTQRVRAIAAHAEVHP